MMKMKKKKMKMSLIRKLANNASRSLIINKSRPMFITYSSAVIRSSSSDDYYNTLHHKEIPSSSLFEGFIKTTRRMSRFYRRTFADFDRSSMLVRPEWSEETDDAVHYHIGMSGMSDEEIKISVEKNKTVTIIGEGDGVFAAECGFRKYVCYIDLPDIDSPVKYYTTNGIKANMGFYSAMVELIIPKLKQHETQDVNDDDQRNTFNLTVNRTFKEYQDHSDHNDYQDEDDVNDEDDHSDKMASLIKVVQIPPIISKCLNFSSQLFLRTINDGQHRRLNVAVNSISTFIYINIMNRFGLFTERVYGLSGKNIDEPSIQETDEFLYYYFQLNGVMSHEKVNVIAYYNQLFIKGIVYDEFKATHHVRTRAIYLHPEDSYYLRYNMRDIKADFRQGDEGGELKLTIPKFDTAERMMNDKKNEAGEFSKLKHDAFMFLVKVNPSI